MEADYEIRKGLHSYVFISLRKTHLFAKCNLIDRDTIMKQKGRRNNCKKKVLGEARRDGIQDKNRIV